MTINHDAPDWIEDCMKWRGKVLKGIHAHWCWDWDGLPVDETTPEYEACTCYEIADERRDEKGL